MDELIASFGYGAFVLVLCAVIFVHELGHYAVARWCGVRVETFSIGFGREIWGRTDKYGTRWKIGLLPLGGYVKMFGEHSMPNEGGTEAGMTPAQQAVSFSHKTLGQRAAIVFAGPGANFLFAIVAYALVLFFAGEPKQQDFMDAGIGTVVEGSAAYEAGLLPGDRLLAIDGDELTSFVDLQQKVLGSEGKELRILVDRAGVELIVPVAPKSVEVTGEDGEVRTSYRLGVGGPPPIHEPVGLIDVLWKAPVQTFEVGKRILVGFGSLISGAVGIDQLGGPIMIAQASNEVAQFGLISLIGFTAFLSINLGIINLFPIPILDGGHLLFYAIEAVRGKPPGERAQEYSLRIGLAVILTLMLFVTVNDLIRLSL